MIDYPVMQTDNNEYYMNNDFDYAEIKSDSILMGFRCDIMIFPRHDTLFFMGYRMKKMVLCLKDFLKLSG